MPQMFPMPTLTLMVLVSILFLISVMRTFWQLTLKSSEVKSILNIKMLKSFGFTQTW